MPSFSEWLRDQVNRNDSTGRLALAVQAIRQWNMAGPTSSTYAGWSNYLLQGGHYDYEWQEALEAAWKEWNALKKGALLEEEE